MNQDDQDDHPDTPIIILGIRMTFGGGGGGLSSGAEGVGSLGQPIILVTRMIILFFIYQSVSRTALKEILVCGLDYRGRSNEHCQGLAHKYWVDCRNIDCRVKDDAVFRAGGCCGLMQMHTLSQAALAHAMDKAVCILREYPHASSQIGFYCDHGRHRSAAAACIFRSVFDFFHASICLAIDGRWM